jgi:hypothetical protein
MTSNQNLLKDDKHVFNHKLCCMENQNYHQFLSEYQLYSLKFKKQSFALCPRYYEFFILLHSKEVRIANASPRNRSLLTGVPRYYSNKNFIWNCTTDDDRQHVRTTDTSWTDQ